MKKELNIIYFSEGKAEVLKLCPSYINVMVSCDGEIIVRDGTQRKAYVTMSGGITPVKMVRVSPTASQAVARLVADAWLDKPNRIASAEKAKDRICVIHLDGNPLNNHYQNIKWATTPDFNKNQQRLNKGFAKVVKYPKLLKVIMVDLSIKHGNAHAIKDTGIGEAYFSNMKSAILKGRREARTSQLADVEFGKLTSMQAYKIVIHLKKRPSDTSKLAGVYAKECTIQIIESLRNFYCK